MNKFLLILPLLLLIYPVVAQKQECKVTFLIKREDNKLIELNSRHGLMEYNSTTGDFRFNFDIASFPGDLVSIDSAFTKLTNTKVFFSGNTNLTYINYTNAIETQSKDMPLDGTLTLNGIDKLSNTRFIPLKTKLHKDRRLTWYFDLDPNDFSIPFYNKVKRIEILVKDGFLNIL